ncbi:MAG: hypothetical protein OEY70_08850 [Acidimicrobiia bacterium]|nr:hypothetical protein [Acidimicrobiia bacterium]
MDDCLGNRRLDEAPQNPFVMGSNHYNIGIVPFGSIADDVRWVTESGQNVDWFEPRCFGQRGQLGVIEAVVDEVGGVGWVYHPVLAAG